MRHNDTVRSLLILTAVAGLSLFGCTSDYENDDDAATTDEYGATSQPTGTVDTGVTGGMDAGADDSGIKDRIQVQLDADSRFRDVDIDIDDGIVTIDGQVANQADLDAVTLLVRGVQGVRDVKLDIDIETEMNK
jgi:hypothetical protein